MISSRLVRPLVKVVGQPARRGGGEAGTLASENAVRNPSRTASTAAALMIGLALVTVVATLGTSMRNSDKAAIASQLDTDFVVTSKNGFDLFQAQAGDLIASVPGVGVVTNVRQEKAKVGRRDDHGARSRRHGRPDGEVPVDGRQRRVACRSRCRRRDPQAAVRREAPPCCRQRRVAADSCRRAPLVHRPRSVPAGSVRPHRPALRRRRHVEDARSTPRSRDPRTSSRSSSLGRTPHLPR